MHIEHLAHLKAAVVDRQVDERDVYLADLEQFHRVRRGTVGDLELDFWIFQMEFFQIGKQKKTGRACRSRRS